VQIRDGITGNPVLTYRGHQSEVLTVAWSPDGTRIASGSGDNTVGVWQAILP
jgi:eukaryotic-like serine/threonine-protein kinase